MKIILKIIKWICKVLGGFIFLILLSGLCFRLFSSKPVPPGKLVDVNGVSLHIRAEGQKNDLPTLILESGAAGDTDVFHWIAEGLKKNMRVVRYDREGKWFSESSNDSITPDFYALQLHQLLEESGEKPPYILAGHSMGGPYNRIFRDLYPNEIKGMVFLDSSHPEQIERLSQTDSQKKQDVQKYMSILADMGILGLVDQIFGSLINVNNDLPKDCQTRYRTLYLNSGKVLRRMIKEYNFVNDTLLKTVGQVSDLDSLLQKTGIVYHLQRIKVNHPQRVKVSIAQRMKVNH